MLDFLKFYIENPVEHANANCSACVIYDSTSKLFIGALTLQDVSNMVLYFKESGAEEHHEINEKDHLLMHS